MGKISLDFSVFDRADPVTGEVSTIIRKGSSRQTSERLKNFQRCVREQMVGREFTVPDDPAQSSRNLRQALAEAARQCGR